MNERYWITDEQLRFLKIVIDGGDATSPKTLIEKIHDEQRIKKSKKPEVN